MGCWAHGEEGGVVCAVHFTTLLEQAVGGCVERGPGFFDGGVVWSTMVGAGTPHVVVHPAALYGGSGCVQGVTRCVWGECVGQCGGHFWLFIPTSTSS
jgi:hypothetical protein